MHHGDVKEIDEIISLKIVETPKKQECPMLSYQWALWRIMWELDNLAAGYHTILRESSNSLFQLHNRWERHATEVLKLITGSYSTLTTYTSIVATNHPNVVYALYIVSLLRLLGARINAILIIFLKLHSGMWYNTRH